MLHSTFATPLFSLCLYMTSSTVVYLACMQWQLWPQPRMVGPQTFEVLPGVYNVYLVLGALHGQEHGRSDQDVPWVL